MIRIALAQVNMTVGDFEGNLARCCSFWERGRQEGAHLVLFPEMTLPGYHAQDLLNRVDFLEANRRALNEAALWTEEGPAILMGFCDVEAGLSSPGGLPVRMNGAAFCMGGKVEQVFHKSLLPTYDVFDESRYFRPARNHQVLPFRGGVLGITICEDLWDEDYSTKPSTLAAAMGAQVVLNLSASPFHENKPSMREAVYRRAAIENEIPVIVCNLVGGQDELLFDGGSLVLNAQGEVVGRGKSFEEDFVVVEVRGSSVECPHNEAISSPRDRYSELFSALVMGTRDYFSKTGHSQAVLGLSGGIDSSLVALISTEALGAENINSYLLPTRYTSEESTQWATELANRLGLSFSVLKIEELFVEVKGALTSLLGKIERGVTSENIQARLRALLLMGVANERGALLLNTSNKTELALGYSTLYGDMCGSIAPIADLPKSDVFGLSRWAHQKGFGIPEGVIDREPTAELAPNQVDPFDYGKVSPLVEAMVGEFLSLDQLVEEYSLPLVKEISRRTRLAEFKRRQFTVGLKLTSKAFGRGRRYPIAHRFAPEEDF